MMNLDDEIQYNKIYSRIKSAYPKFDVLEKENSTFMKILNVFMIILSFGQNKEFLTKYITTIGYKIYVPEFWFRTPYHIRIEKLYHEAIHMEQRTRYGILFYPLYLLGLPFPIFFAYYRTKFEKEGYEATMQYHYKRYGEQFFTTEYKNSILEKFSSSGYLWMWMNKSSIEKWYDDFLKEMTSK